MADFPYTALATLAGLFVYFFAAFRVGQARRKYKVAAPATTGDPGFERVFRAHQNMLEWMVLFLPALWLFAAYIGDLWAAMLGAGWTLARLGFIFAYAAEASRRVPFFLAQLLCFACLWGGALFGVIRSLI